MGQDKRIPKIDSNTDSSQKEITNKSVSLKVEVEKEHEAQSEVIPQIHDQELSAKEKLQSLKENEESLWKNALDESIHKNHL